MKKIAIFLLIIFISVQAKSQDESSSFDFKFFPSIHFGFFNPSDVNAYIENDLSEYSIEFGTTDLVMNFNIGLGASLRFFSLFEIQPVFEYSIAPKIISGADESYSFTKMSGGVIANFLIPLSDSKKHSVVIGAGMLFNQMNFEEFSGTSFNPRFQAGISLNNRKFNPQIILAYDLAKANDSDFEDFELDYSSVRIGVNLNF
jgi:hypothetical protein